MWMMLTQRSSYVPVSEWQGMSPFYITFSFNLRNSIKSTNIHLHPVLSVNKKQAVRCQVVSTQPSAVTGFTVTEHFS